MAIIKRLQITNFDKDMGKRETLYTVGRNVNRYSHCGKQYWRVLKKQKYTCHPEQMKTLIQKDMCTPIFIAGRGKQGRIRQG